MHTHRDPSRDGSAAGRPRGVTRRDALRRGILGLAALSAPVSLTALAARRGGAQAAPSGDVTGVLNLALLLEYLEAEFYAQGLARTGLVPVELRDFFAQLREHEQAHVELLRGALGSAAIPEPTFDFTAGGGSGAGPLSDAFTDFATFVALAQAFEDLGASAYKTAVPVLAARPDLLATALRIHSVEARHAAVVRRIRGVNAWITGDDTTLDFARAIYANEARVVQAGVDVAAVAPVPTLAVTEAFDEPIPLDVLYEVLGPFLASFACGPANGAAPSALKACLAA